MAKLVITIDGPAASGKSTVARLMAEKLDAKFLDTGAMYRAVTLAAMQKNADMKDEEKLLEILENTEFRFQIKNSKTTVFVDEIDVTDRLRRPDVTANARHIASAAKIREKLVQMQRFFAEKYQKIVAEGRDQGTVAFPDADMKFYLDADINERAKRRLAELKAKGDNWSLEQIKNAIEQRDKTDENRNTGPLKPAKDAIIVDTTDLTIEQVVKKLTSFVEKKTQKQNGSWWFAFARYLCKIFCVLFFKITVFGKENVPQKGPFLLISNHQSFLDPLFCGVFLKRHLYFLARDTLFRNYLFGKLLASVNVIPVRRSEADISAVKTVISKLKQGRGVCLFPEATRTKDGKIADLKPGFGLLGRRGQAAIIPTIIEGAFECWPRHKKIFSPGAEIVVCYGKPITEDKIKQMTDTQLAKKITEKMRQMQNKCRIRQGKKTLKY